MKDIPWQKYSMRSFVLNIIGEGQTDTIFTNSFATNQVLPPIQIIKTHPLPVRAHKLFQFFASPRHTILCFDHIWDVPCDGWSSDETIRRIIDKAKHPDIRRIEWRCTAPVLTIYEVSPPPGEEELQRVFRALRPRLVNKFEQFIQVGCSKKAFPKLCEFHLSYCIEQAFHRLGVQTILSILSVYRPEIKVIYTDFIPTCP